MIRVRAVREDHFWNEENCLYLKRAAIPIEFTFLSQLQFFLKLLPFLTLLTLLTLSIFLVTNFYAPDWGSYCELSVKSGEKRIREWSFQLLLILLTLFIFLFRLMLLISPS